MDFRKLIKNNLQGNRPVFLQIGFVATLLFMYMVSLPINAQEPIQDTVPKEIFTVLEPMPEFPGGEEARTRFLIENTQYPIEAKEEGLHGQVLLGFIVEPDGKITNIEVRESSGHTILDEEAIRVVKLMPKWNPGKVRGRAVRVQFQIPITFTLKNDKPEEDIEENK